MSTHEDTQENECKDIEVRLVGKDGVDFYVKNRLMSLESAEKLHGDLGRALKAGKDKVKPEKKPEPKHDTAEKPADKPVSKPEPVKPATVAPKPAVKTGPKPHK